MQAFDREHPSQNILNIATRQGPWPIYLPLPAKTRGADDETLIRLIHHGSKTDSQSAIETIFIRHHKDVWRYVRSRVSSASDADEIAAGVWVVVLEKIYDFVWTGAPIKSWLISIAHKKILEFFSDPLAVSLEQLSEQRGKALRFIAVQLQLLDRSEPPQQFPDMVRREADEILHKLIGRLSDIERQIIMLIYFEEVETATEVARRLGMNKNTIRVYHKRARDKLRASPELRSLFEGSAP
jgi:RNA polymerase sigma factor (sigma-70 family)